MYGDMSLSAMQAMTKAYSYICAAMCFIIATLLLVVFYFAIRIGASQSSNRITAYFYSFNNVLIPLIIMVLFYAILYAN